jgi:signal transduction histidine kinase
MVIESAEHRVLRVLALSVGIGSVIFSLLGLPGLLEQSPYLDPVYRWALYIVFFGLPVLLGVLWAGGPIRVLRGIAVAHAASSIVFLLTWNLALADGGIPDDPEPFLLLVISISTCMAALVLSYLGSWLYIVAVAVISGIMRIVGYAGDPDFVRSLQDALFIALFSAVMMTLIQLALAIGRRQDLAAAETQESAASAKAAEALDRQRTRYHAFTHDDVLATLNSAVHNAPDALLAVRESARTALEKMDEFRDGTVAQAHMSASEFESLVRGAAVGAGAELVEIRVQNVAPNLRVPVDVSDAMAEALAEAVRNSIRHAGWPDGRPVHREIDVDIRDEAVRIVVTDDGVGFASRRVAPDRLGVRISILQRVNSQPGGFASVVSSRGRGTSVTISWADEAARS